MRISPFLYSAAVALLLGGIVYNFTNQPNMISKPQPAPLVIELFTSKNCPSCPPADQILATLARDPNVMALSCHVSYWDYANNKDAFAQDFCEVRQHGYVREENGGTGGKIFTPQMVVNGESRFIGYQKASVNRALEQAATRSVAPIKLSLSEDRTVSISLPQLNNGSFRLWAFGYADSHDLDTKRPVINPALSFDNLGAWDGHAGARSMQVLNEKISGLLVVAQENGYGRIVAAGRVDLRQD